MKRTDAAKSFDDVILTMWKDYQDRDAGFDTEEVREICERAAGGSFGALFTDYVYGVKEVPFEDYLEIAGYEPGERHGPDEQTSRKGRSWGLATPTNKGR